ncbi:hypothetical protein AC1031_014955 [Aphanomyces cochlioides]|nr:hypothetical protein AC1031_014955 [Aphanomyces cochlioides]
MQTTGPINEDVATGSAEKHFLQATANAKNDRDRWFRTASHNATNDPFVPVSKHQKRKDHCKLIVRVVWWLMCMSIEVVAYLVVPYWAYMDISPLVANLISPSYSIMAGIDPGPTMAAWDVSLYTGFNTTAHENEVLLRRLIDQVDSMPRGSQIDIPVNQTPFLMVVSTKAIFHQSVSKTNQAVDATSGRYTLLVGKKFTISDPVFDHEESLVLYFRVDNKVHGYTALRVLQAVNASETHQTLVDVSHVYPDLLGSAKFIICTTNRNAGTNRCGSIILPQATVDSLIIDEQKTFGPPETPPSCTHPMMPTVVYSIIDIQRKTFHCPSDPSSILARYAFENLIAVIGIPSVPNQALFGAGVNVPTGFRLPLRGVGFLDATPNATTIMLPYMQGGNFVWIGQTSRIDFIIRTQLATLFVSRVATAVGYMLLLFKFSWTSGRSFIFLLVDYMTLEVTNKSFVDTTIAVTLVTTYWQYRDMMIAMLVRQLYATIPWTGSILHTYEDDLRFIPGPVCFNFIIAMSATKHILNSCRICIRLSYVAVYLATIILATGALTHQGPAVTSIRSADPYALSPALVAPMVLSYYRTSPHLDVYYYMGYAAAIAIFLPLMTFQWWQAYRRKQRRTHELAATTCPYTSLDVAVGIAIRYPGGFMDKSRMYTAGKHPDGVKSTVYSLAMAGYITVDGCLMLTSSVNRCLAAYVLGSVMDTSGPIHYFQLTDDGTAVKSTFQLRTFPTEFIRDRPLWHFIKSISLGELE